MTALTIRLSEEDHRLFQVYCLMTGRSQNSIVIDLLHAEFDRVLPGKRQELSDPDAFWKALGVERPQPTAEDRAWSAAIITSLGGASATEAETGGGSGRSAA